MIDLRLLNDELREARRIRLRAQAAGRYLDALVRYMHRTRQPWQHYTMAPALTQEPQPGLLSH